MKKRIFIFSTVLLAFSLTAFGYMSWSDTPKDQAETTSSETVVFENVLLSGLIKKVDPDLVYKVDSRFIWNITKEDLLNATSIVDILPAKATQSIMSYHSVRIEIIDEASIMGDSHILTAAQLHLLQSVDYATDIYIRADYKIKNAYTGEFVHEYLPYYISIIPETEAEYEGGHDALAAYLRENSKDKTAIITRDKLKPGKVSFTVTKEGTIADATLTSTSGYPSVDEALVELISNMPEKWNPAANAKGEKVDQKLVFFFGLQGC